MAEAGRIHHAASEPESEGGVRAQHPGQVHTALHADGNVSRLSRMRFLGRMMVGFDCDDAEVCFIAFGAVGRAGEEKKNFDFIARFSSDNAIRLEGVDSRESSDDARSTKEMIAGG